MAAVTAPAAARAPVATSARHLASGARAMVPWLLGVAPYGLVIGVSAARADVSTFAGWLTGPLIYSGSAQVAAIELLDGGAAPAVVIVAVLAINARLVLYSATMAPRWAGRPVWWQAACAYLLIDPSLAVGSDGYERLDDRRAAHLHYLGGGVTLWVAWLAAITAGATVGGQLPAGLRLELVVPLFLVGEVVPKLADPVNRRAVVVAAVTAAVAASAPLHLGPLLAIGAGVAAGIGWRGTGR